MLGVAVAVGLVVLGAGFVYLRHERQGWPGAGLAALRVVGLGALILLFVNPMRTARVIGGAPTVLLDASLSMQAVGGRWAEAVDTARSLANGGGVVLRFGSEIERFDGNPPVAGTTLLRDALTAARARGGPTVVVTDGEIEDIGSLPAALTPGTRFVVLTRDTVPNAALLGVNAPERIQRDDSLSLTLTVGTWADLPSDSGRLLVAVGERQLARADLALPSSPGNARRRVVLRPGLLTAGVHVLRIVLDVPGDAESRDNQRHAVIEVSEQPAIVVIVDPADWEGRFLVAELADVARTTVRGYARTGRRSWVDMRSLKPVTQQAVERAARNAGLLIVRGRRQLGRSRQGGPTWLWPASDPRLQVLEGDWYLTRELSPSPLAGRLAGLELDSLAPLNGIIPLVPAEDEWVAIAARQGRRGAERGVLLGRDSAGVRTLTTTGSGLWRWRLRGGAAREAYRAILAAGTDWLLADRTGSAGVTVTASRVVQRGMPVVFRWTGPAPAPDSLSVTLTADTTSMDRMLRFRPDGTALLALEPGIYRWVVPGAANVRGVSTVESYSAEYPAGAVLNVPQPVGEAFTLIERQARERWWLFVLAILALAAEWAWRQRRGLP